ncbi:MAG: C39 family peptidase [Patescibacteria group bacterium]
MNVKDVFSKNNIHIQEIPYACGPSTLLNVLHLKGDSSHSEQELVELCKAKPVLGTSNENLIKAAKQVGLKLVEEKSNALVQDIERNIDAGVSVIVNYFHAFAGEGHYAVVTNYDNKALYLVDSSFGLLRLRKEDFEKFWYNSDKTIYGWYAAVV